MEFLFFTAADAVLFSRDDAESAVWTVEEMSLSAEFPYIDGKAIQRGQRIGFTDPEGVFQFFEIRKVESLEPDHYQRITAEHIAISELSDEHTDNAEITDETAGAALGGLLTGTLWQVGTDTTTGAQSADISRGSVWQAVRTVESNWNAYILPRVTYDATGITGRYLDIIPAGGTWRGLRLSLDKNTDEAGIVYDDSEVITAMYGYGKSTDNQALTFADAEWTQTADHPAKPSGQTYIEDPEATALYGRNGRPRWGFYQNADIDDAEILIEKTWASLKTSNAPKVTVDCTVRDLYRLGYADEPIRLHDTVLVDIQPIGAQLQLEIVQLTVDLLDPTATRPIIGAYIPNIIYINRETASQAGGGGGGGRSGGGRGQTKAELQRSEFETEITANQYQINLRAYQVDMTNVETILQESGVAISAGGTIIYANNNLNDMKSDISVNADNIALSVTNGALDPAKITLAINDESSTATIKASKIVLNGETVANKLTADEGAFNDLFAGNSTATHLKAYIMTAGTLSVTAALSVEGTAVGWQNKTVLDSNGNPINIRYLGYPT